jgi:hypothetical protein
MQLVSMRGAAVPGSSVLALLLYTRPGWEAGQKQIIEQDKADYLIAGVRCSALRRARLQPSLRGVRLCTWALVENVCFEGALQNARWPTEETTIRQGRSGWREQWMGFAGVCCIRALPCFTPAWQI